MTWAAEFAQMKASHAFTRLRILLYTFTGFYRSVLSIQYHSELDTCFLIKSCFLNAAYLFSKQEFPASTWFILVPSLKDLIECEFSYWLRQGIFCLSSCVPSFRENLWENSNGSAKTSHVLFRIRLLICPLRPGVDATCVRCRASFVGFLVLGSKH